MPAACVAQISGSESSIRFHVPLEDVQDVADDLGLVHRSGLFFRVLPHVRGRQHNRFEDWGSVALVFGFDASPFDLWLCLDTSFFFEGSVQTFHQTTRASFGLVAG